MKSLYESILDDFDTIVDKTDPKKEVKAFIDKYCKTNGNIKISARPNKDGFYEVSSNGSVYYIYDICIQEPNGISLTNGLFVWKNIKGDFWCNSINITSLDGAPRKVGGFFCCMETNITSLEGAPQEVGSFQCAYCKSLKTLEGGPIKVDGGYDVRHTDITTLKGAPKEINGVFDCSSCLSLKSLEGGPIKVGRGFRCDGCIKLDSLKGIPQEIKQGSFYAVNCGKPMTFTDIEKYAPKLYQNKDIKFHLDGLNPSVLWNHVGESLLDDFDTIETNSDPISEIRKFIADNYAYGNELKISKKPNKNGYYEVSVNGDVYADYEIQNLTNGMFIWKQVKGLFSCEECNDLSSLEGAPQKVEVFKCAYCYGLTSLKGAPKITTFGFDCHDCDNLISLEGAPTEVGGGFDCSSCEKLTTLKGAPKKVDGFFNCEWCPSLTSLEGAPEEVNHDFRCNGCKKLKSLKGAPRKIGRTVYCTDCGKQFTMSDIEKYIDEIYNKDIIDL